MEHYKAQIGKMTPMTYQIYQTTQRVRSSNSNGTSFHSPCTAKVGVKYQLIILHAIHPRLENIHEQWTNLIGYGCLGHYQDPVHFLTRTTRTLKKKMKLGVEIRCLMHGTHHEFLNNKRRNIEQINVREKEQSDTGNIKHRTQNEDKQKKSKKN